MKKRKKITFYFIVKRDNDERNPPVSYNKQKNKKMKIKMKK